MEYVTKRVACLSSFKKAHVFITGGTGFFGIWLTECLLWASESLGLGLRITSLARDPHTFYARHPEMSGKTALTLVQGNVQNFPFPDTPVTHCIHAATETNHEGCPHWAHRHFTVAIDGTRNILELARRDHARILLTSSGGVYRVPHGCSRNNRHEEELKTLADATSQDVVYGIAKRAVETLGAVWADQFDLNVTIARCFSFLGPWLPLEANYAAANFLHNVLCGTPIIITGDGTPLRSYLYPADLVIWLLTLLERGVAGVPYNVGAQRAVSIEELARITAKSAGLPQSSVEIRGSVIPGVRAKAYLPQTERARSLGLNVNTDIEEAVRKTIQWYKMRMSHGTIEG